MLRYARWFPLVFFTGFLAFITSIGVSVSTEGAIFSHQLFWFMLRNAGMGLMLGGGVMWLGSCRRFAGKPDLNPLFDLMLTVGSGLLVVSMLIYQQSTALVLMWAGVALNGAALLNGVLVQVIDPAYPCHVATTWPEDSRYFFDANLKDETIAHKRYSMIADDLTRIEGIGPGIQAILYEAGIISYAELARLKPEDIKKILASYGFRAPVDPGTWPRQARLAGEGLWSRLYDWQHDLSGGRIKPA